MKFVTIPAFLVALGISLGAAVADRWQFGKRYGRLLPYLAVHPFLFCWWTLLSFGRQSPFARNFRYFFLPRCLFPPNDRCGISADMTDQLSLQIILHQRVVNHRAQFTAGKIGKKFARTSIPTGWPRSLVKPHMRRRLGRARAH